MQESETKGESGVEGEGREGVVGAREGGGKHAHTCNTHRKTHTHHRLTDAPRAHTQHRHTHMQSEREREGAACMAEAFWRAAWGRGEAGDAERMRAGTTGWARDGRCGEEGWPG